MMTKGHNLWHHAAMWLLALTGMFMVSCSTAEEDITPDAEPTQVHVTFTMSLSANNSGTRASQQETGNWGDYSPYQTENGDEFENTVNNLRIAICDKEGNIIGVVNDSKMYGSAASTDSGTDSNTENVAYVVQGTWTPSAEELAKANDGGKVMVFANCGEITKETKLDELSFSNNDIVKNGIPMWGIKKIEHPFELGLSNNLDEIKLLRAVAKVTVHCGDDNDGYELTDVVLHNYNVNGYVLPTYTYNKIDKTESIEFASSIHANTTGFTANQTTTFGFADATDENAASGKSTKVIYVPEYVNKDKTTDTNVSYITFYFTKNGEQTKQYTIQFADYAENNTGEPEANTLHDILRNHHYDFTVNYNAGNVLINAEVNPWWKVDSEVSWDVNDALFLAWEAEQDKKTKVYTYDKYKSNATKGDEEATVCWVAKPRWEKDRKSVVKSGNSSSAQFCFRLQKPTGVVWKAYLTDTQNFLFNYSVVKDYYDYQQGTSERTSVSTGIARELPYCIKVDAKNALNDTKKDGTLTTTDRYTDLYILVQYEDGRYEPVTINPQVENLTTYWKNNRRFAGGSFKQTVYIDGDESKPVVLKEGQWIRIWQTEAILPSSPSSFDQVAKLISEAQSSECQYWKGNSK